jgi:hypothetical protein
MLNGQIYFINSPHLIAAAMRNRSLTFDTFAIDATINLFGASKEAGEAFASGGHMNHVHHVIHNSLNGQSLHRLNVRVLEKIATGINDIPPSSSLDIPNVYLWLRNLVSHATMEGLYGKNNPMNQEAIDCLWFLSLSRNNRRTCISS